LNAGHCVDTALFHSDLATFLTQPCSTMATLSRQPFAPLDGARLKSLASIKNRQNGMSLLSFFALHVPQLALDAIRVL
jgi:hypothetical protein